MIFGAVIRLRAGRTGVQFPAGAIDFSVLHNVEIGSEADLASCSLAAGGKRPGFGSDHSPPSNTEVKND